MNNYEKIKNMSIDDMAEFCSDYFECALCPCNWTSENEDCSEDCHGTIKEWLLKECEE